MTEAQFQKSVDTAWQQGMRAALIAYDSGYPDGARSDPNAPWEQEYHPDGWSPEDEDNGEPADANDVLMPKQGDDK